MLFYFVFSLLLVSCAAQVEICPPGFDIPLSSTCITISADPITYDHANAGCQEQSGHLVYVDSQPKLEELSSALPAGSNFGIGVRYDQGGLFWTASIGLDQTFFAWINGQEPDTTSWIHCVTLDQATEKFVGSECSATVRYICEKNKITASCDQGGRLDVSKLICVKPFHKYRKTFDEAKAACSIAGASLATNLTDKASMLSALGPIKHRGHFWLGIHKPIVPGDFETIDGASLPAQPFRTGRPKADSTNTCVTMKRGRWYDKDCNRKFFYMCQKPAIIE